MRINAANVTNYFLSHYQHTHDSQVLNILEYFLAKDDQEN